MSDENTVDWTMVNNLVEPEHQYKDMPHPIIDEVRMAWPFKTDEEREILRKSFKKDQAKLIKQKRESVGEALL